MALSCEALSLRGTYPVGQSSSYPNITFIKMLNQGALGSIWLNRLGSSIHCINVYKDFFRNKKILKIARTPANMIFHKISFMILVFLLKVIRLGLLLLALMTLSEVLMELHKNIQGRRSQLK